MSGDLAKPPADRGWTALIVTAALLASAAIYDGYHAAIAFSIDDTNHLETPLILATARQLQDGPGTLYGPFSGADPLVLIHAPLYYRLAGGIALILTQAGLDAVVASIVAGRSLSFLGMVAIAAASARIARGGGMGAIVGLWAALLAAGSPVFGSFPFTVRPDTLAIAFQTLAFAWAARAMGWLGDDPRPPGLMRWRLVDAGIGFGLAACFKQSMIVAAGVTTLLLLSMTVRGRARVRDFAGFAVATVAVPAAYYAIEDRVTHGQMWESVFVLPRLLAETAPASWDYVGTVFAAIAKLAVGLIVLAFATFLAGPRKALAGTRLDGILGLLLVAETAVIVPLCLNSNGGWVNYAQPAVVWGSILLARATGRVLAAPGKFFGRLAITVGALAILGRDAQLAERSWSMRREESLRMATVLNDPAVSASSPAERYFAARPQHTRRFGRAGLAHDEWLYSSFEAARRAEPRSSWLAEALSGPVRVVVVPSNGERDDYVDGLGRALESLKYRRASGFGEYSVWLREPLP